jgi:hypothetical protein
MLEQKYFDLESKQLTAEIDTMKYEQLQQLLYERKRLPLRSQFAVCGRKNFVDSRYCIELEKVKDAATAKNSAYDLLMSLHLPVLENPEVEEEKGESGKGELKGSEDNATDKSTTNAPDFLDGSKFYLKGPASLKNKAEEKAQFVVTSKMRKDIKSMSSLIHQTLPVLKMKLEKARQDEETHEKEVKAHEKEEKENQKNGEKNTGKNTDNSTSSKSNSSKSTSSQSTSSQSSQLSAFKPELTPAQVEKVQNLVNEMEKGVVDVEGKYQYDAEKQLGILKMLMGKVEKLLL